MSEATCWSCRERISKTEFFCPQCGNIQPVHEMDPFTLFNIPSTFKIDLEKLTDTYFEHLRKLHPDKFTTKSKVEQKYAMAQVTRLNEAYKALSNPVERSVQLIKVAGWHAPEEERSDLPQAMVLRQFELREALESVQDEAALKKLRDSVREEVKECLSMLDKAFKKHEETEAKCKTVELQFLQKFQKEIEHRSKIVS
jgi:molecular chaperone HscB